MSPSCTPCRATYAPPSSSRADATASVQRSLRTRLWALSACSIRWRSRSRDTIHEDRHYVINRVAGAIRFGVAVQE